MAFTNFCCRSGGSNLNAGTRTGNTTEPGTTADLTYASGSWVSATCVFTVASGNPVSDGVAVGDFASVYANGSTLTNFVGRVTARTATTITVSTTAKHGTSPADGTSTRTLKIGGAWKGPNAAEGFPFSFINNTGHDGTNFLVRVNFKNDATYAITTGITHATNGGVTFQGYTSAYGDGGKATIDASTNAVVILTVSTSSFFADFICSNNGASGTNAGISNTAGASTFLRCVVHDVRGNGFLLSSTRSQLIECEAYLCNTSNTATSGGMTLANAGNTAVRCVSHNNAGTNSSGFIVTSSQVGGCFNCIADTNGGHGFVTTVSAVLFLTGCDAYANVGDGVNVVGGNSGFYIESSNFIDNGGVGVRGLSATTTGYGQMVLVNCGFGAGTMANTGGDVVGSNVQNLNPVTYASDKTPWVDPNNGDFRINLATAKGAGRGGFTETQASYAGTVGYFDIGAAQHLHINEASPTYQIGI